MAAAWGGQAALIGLATAVYLPIAAIGVARVAWWEYTRTLPSVAALADYQPAAVTVLYDRNGVVLGELFVERRYELSIDQIPEVVQQAFVAGEDGAFWSHGGIDYLGVARAALRNVDEGRAAQGASTITQQVVKNLVLNNPHKTFRRKLDEAALAWEVEATYDKGYILELYLNSIFFGASSYGVEAAARSYFGKHVEELSLGEVALLAGLPQRPSEYNPFRNLPRARERQAYVLGRMVDQGYVTQAEANAALAAPIVLRPSKNTFLDNAPHFTEHVRRWLVEQLGEEVVNRGGLQVTTTCDLELQRAAQAAVHDRVTELDRGSGLRRAGRRTVPEAEILDWRAAHPAPGPLVAGEVYEGVVTGVRSDQLVVAVGEHELALFAHDHPWISPRHRSPSFDEKVASADEREAYWKRIEAQREAAAAELLAGGLTDAPPELELPEAPGVPLVAVGDLLQVTPADGDVARVADGRRLPRGRLVQPRELEGALLSMELGTGAVRALVGGADFEGSQFNRAIQGRRQVGSTFKPFVYAAALASREYTAATIVSDDPLSIDLGRGNAWTPRNYGRDSMEPMTVAQGLARSRNLVLVRTMIGLDEWMDGDVVYTFARALGLGGPPTAALPAGWAPTPDTQYLCPWTNERKSAWYCRDHQPPLPPDTDMKAHRKALPKETDHQCRSCDYSIGLGSASLTLAEMVRAYSAFGAAGQLVEPYFVQEVRDRDGNVLISAEPQLLPVIDPGVAYVTQFMLRGVVERGTARDAAGLGVPVAGKTGTTDEGRDAWFIGMTPELLTGVWVGFDQPQPISERATGSRIALPIFVRYTREAVALGRLDPLRGWDEPVPGSVSFAQVDERTGGRLDSGGRRYPFLPGTEPPIRAPVADAAVAEPGLAELE
ncbi:MAG: transglycosylase domain-containing protein [Myxococcota bacterium]